jgi:hypothetical protein
MRRLTALPAAPTAAQAHRLRAEGYRRLAEAEDLAAQLADAAPEPAPGEYVTVRAAAERMACSASQVYDLALAGRGGVVQARPDAPHRERVGGSLAAPAYATGGAARMRPYYDEGGITIYHGRAEDVLPTLGADTVDLVLADPPYGARHRWTWDRPVAGWPDATRPALKFTGSLWCCRFAAASFLEHADTSAGWHLAQDVVWRKTQR